MNKWLKFILAVLGLALAGLLIAMLFNQPKEAGATTVEDWSCQSNGSQCGTNEGTEYVCPKDYTRYQNTCRKWVDAVYNCKFTVDIHGTNQNTEAFYVKPTGDDHHCHAINWNSLDSTKQNSFKTMHHNDYDYSSPNHGNWTSAYNSHITQNPEALKDDGTGEWSYATKVSQSCNAGDPRYDSCEPAGRCSEKCGITEAYKVPDGKGGSIECGTTPACPVKEVKHATIVGSCDGSFKVTIWSGDTRRTWRVEGVEAWIDYQESHEFVATSLDTVIEWKHQDHWDLADESYVTRTSATNCEQPKEEQRSESVLQNNTTDAPQCTATRPVLEALNFHILRNGDTAIAKWMPTNGNKANIYYKLVTSDSWEHAVRDIDNNGYFVINGLGNRDWTFALQQSNDCAGGLMSQYVVDGGTSKWVLFR
jgi:hypothetical protein